MGCDRRNCSPHPRIACALLLFALVSCSPPEVTRRLEIHFPALATAAQTSQNTALCAQLDATFTMVASTGSTTPQLDAVAMEPVAGVPCTWEVGAKDGVPTGPTYDLIVHFRTHDSVGTCTGPVDIGAYVVLAVPFPFDDSFPGFVPELFFSGRDGELDDIPITAGADAAELRASYAAALVDLGFDFDLDADGYTNLTDLLIHDPCAATLPPSIELTGPNGVPLPSTTAEGQPIDLVVTLQPGGAAGDLGIGLSIAHSHDLAATPYYLTQEIVASVGTDAPASIVFVPALGSQPPRELWNVLPSVDAAGLQWTFRFLPEEPFVGDLTLTYQITDIAGENVLAAFFRDLTVTDVPDDPVLMLGDGVASPAAAVLIPFPELVDGTASPAPPNNNNEVVVWELTFQDDDIPTRAALAAPQWTPAVTATNAPLTLQSVGGPWRLSWDVSPTIVGPTNADVIGVPTGGYFVDLEMTADGEIVATMTMPVSITPLWNHPLLIEPLDSATTSLPAPPFAAHVFPIFVRDPDRVQQAPGCVLTIVEDSSCPGGFPTVSCDVVGSINVDTWRFDATFTPSGDYETRCGANAQFNATLQFTDQPPPGATNGVRVANSWCSLPGQQPPCTQESVLRLRSQGLTVTTALTGGPAAPPLNWEAESPAMINGFVGRAVVTMKDPTSNDRRTYIANLDDPGNAFMVEIPTTKLCDVPSFWHGMGTSFEADPPRSFILGRAESGLNDCNVGPHRWVVIDYANPDNPSVTAYDPDVICNGLNYPYVAPDPAGNFWAVCEGGVSGTDRLIRFDTSGGVTDEIIDVPTVFLPQDPLAASHFDGTRTWLTYGARDEIVLIDTSTFGDGTPGVSVDLYPVTINYSYLRVADIVSDPSRNLLMYLVIDRSATNEEQADLYWFAFPNRVLQGPLNLGVSPQSQGERGALILRESGTASPPVSDLTFYWHFATADVAHVDLDSMTVFGTRPLLDYFDQGYGFRRCPDRRYQCDMGKREFQMVPWDLTLPPLSVDLGGVPDGNGQYFEVQVSDVGHVIVIQTSATGGPAQRYEVIFFPASQRGED